MLSPRLSAEHHHLRHRNKTEIKLSRGLITRAKMMTKVRESGNGRNGVMLMNLELMR